MAAMSNEDADVLPEGEWKEETDTVEARFGGEASEATLDMMRQLKKPDWMEEDSSLDPVEDMEEHARHNLRIPPATYDALQEAAAEEIARLQGDKELQLSPEDAQLIKYRKQLVDGTSVDDVKWLKLRAYHRAMDKLRANIPTQEERRQLMELHEVPLDKVPMELVEATPEQLADRWQQAQQAGVSAEACIYSEDSEWARDWDSTSYVHDDAARRELQAAILPQRNFRVGFSIRNKRRPADPLESFGEVMLDGDPEKVQKKWQPIHSYTAEYLQEQAMERQLQAQKRQRALAFWLPLGTVFGMYTVKWLKRLMKPKKGSKSVPKASPKIAA